MRIVDLVVPLESAAEPREHLVRLLARNTGVAPEFLAGLTVVRRALDARKKPPRFVFAVEIDADPALAQALRKRSGAQVVSRPRRGRWVLERAPDGPRPVVVGAGPAGLFAALTLAQGGWPPRVFERGKAVHERARDVSALYARGILDRESNVCFGEGGAGTFSDGKLYTRGHDERVARVLETFVARGADPDILVSSRPHLGTDRLIALLTDIRTHLIRLGATVEFGQRVARLDIRDAALRGAMLADGTSVDSRAAILATGHSAREIWQALEQVGVSLEARPFAMGFRIEHPQGLIDTLRYGRWSGNPALPAADYRLAYNEPDGCGVYSFCMCPGGVVVPTPTEPDALCINGMSHASRAGRFANSALVVSVTLEDLAQAGHTGLYAGVHAQQASEAAAYAAGGGHFVAPGCRVTDFLAQKISTDLPKTSYRRGLAPADLAALYPAPVIAALRRALVRFDSSMRGFVTNEATLIGVETRTASPIRVLRGEDFQAHGAGGLYPAGEGMGYGGGIVSSAVDGIRAAEAMLQANGASWRQD